MAKLYQRAGSPYWWAKGYDAQGELWRRSTKQTEKTKASRVAREIERRLLLEASRPRLALRDTLDMLAQHKKQKGVADATMSILAEKGGWLLAVLGPNYDVNALTLRDAQDYVDRRLGDGVSLHTIHKEWGTLRSALRHARRHKLYPGDPADIWPDSLVSVYTPRDRWLRPEELRKLLPALPSRRRDHVTIYCYTGVRYSELYRMRRQHLDSESRSIWVDGHKGRKDRAQRTIPLAPEAWEILSVRAADTPKNGPLFRDTWGRSVMARTLKSASKKAGIARVDSANDLRRTFATWLFHEGVPEATTIRLMGHANSQMVRRVYSQHSPDLLRRAIDRLPKLCADSVPSPSTEQAHLALVTEAKHAKNP